MKKNISILMLLYLVLNIGCRNSENRMDTRFSVAPPDAMPIIVPLTPASNGKVAQRLFMPVTVCMPGTTHCRTFNNMIVDTGGFGVHFLQTTQNADGTVSLGTGSEPLALPMVKAFSGSFTGGILSQCELFGGVSTLWGPLAFADIY